MPSGSSLMANKYFVSDDMKVATLRETPKGSVQDFFEVQTKDRELLSYKNNSLYDDEYLHNRFTFLRRIKNPEYENGLKIVPLRSCLLHNNSDGIVSKNAWIIKTLPKWQTDLLHTRFSTETGEIRGISVYTTDDLKSGNNRKIKAVNRFCDYFWKLRDSYKCSILFYTFTVANQSKVNISQCIEALKMRLKRKGINLQGYVWILEVSDDLHVHYHSLIATDRIRCKGKSLPNYLKMDNVWGARCQVRFADKGVQYYLANYFTKNQNRILGKRQFGKKIPKK